MENISCLPEVLMLFRSLNARKHEELKMLPSTMRLPIFHAILWHHKKIYEYLYIIQE